MGPDRNIVQRPTLPLDGPADDIDTITYGRTFPYDTVEMKNGL